MQASNTTLDDISAVIGFTGALHLSAWFGGGNNLYIPDTIDDGHFIARLLGLKNAQRLVDEWSNQHLTVPSMKTYAELLKRKQIGRQFEMGFGSREIATQFRMTERRVQQICRELEAAGLIAVIGPVTRTERERSAAFSPSIIASPRKPLKKKAPARRVTAQGKNAGIVGVKPRLYAAKS